MFCIKVILYICFEIKNLEAMKKIIEPAAYGIRPISFSRYLISPKSEIYETDVKIKKYKGFDVEFVEHIELDGTHIRFKIKKINNEKVNNFFHSSEVRDYIDNIINKVFERINGDKESVENDKLFLKATSKSSELDMIDSLLINAIYNYKQTNWCFKYLYDKGVSLNVLSKYLY